MSKCSTEDYRGRESGEDIETQEKNEECRKDRGYCCDGYVEVGLCLSRCSLITL